jgi:hypothetical protein
MRNDLLDYYKILLAIFVVGIHTSPFLEYSKPLSFVFNLGIFRLAVPTFFLINGFYATAALETKQNLKIYLLRVLKLYVFWTILYFPLFMYTHYFSFKNIVWGIIVVFYGYGHLWYVTALLGGIALFYFLLQHYSKKTILILAVIFYFIGCFIELLQEYYSRSESGFIVEVAHLQLWKLNFIFFAFPFICIGYYLKKEVSHYSFLRYWYVALLVFSAELFCSYYFLPLGRNMLFSLLLITPCIFYYFITKNYFQNKTFFLSNYIDKLPNSIYYVHGLVVFFSHSILTNISNTNRFIIVSFFSILIGIFLIKINKFIYNKFRFYIV